MAGRKEIKIGLLIHDLKNRLAVIQAGVNGLLSRPERCGPLTPKQEKVLNRLLRNTPGGGPDTGSRCAGGGGGFSLYSAPTSRYWKRTS